jgi:hypothetical protein
MALLFVHLFTLQLEYIGLHLFIISLSNIFYIQIYIFILKRKILDELWGFQGAKFILPSSVLWHRVVLYIVTNAPEDPISSIFRIEFLPSR